MYPSVIIHAIRVRKPNLKRKPLKPKRCSRSTSCAAAAIITFGGSPTIEATPPVSDRIASARSGGIGLIPIFLQIRKVIGAIMMMAVTLSITNERTVVKVPRYTMSRQGSPLLNFEALIATNSKNPDTSNNAAKIIIPSSSPITSNSIQLSISCSRELPSPRVKTLVIWPKNNIMMQPSQAATARCIFSDRMRVKLSTKISSTTVCAAIITRRLLLDV